MELLTLCYRLLLRLDCLITECLMTLLDRFRLPWVPLFYCRASMVEFLARLVRDPYILPGEAELSYLVPLRF